MVDVIQWEQSIQDSQAVPFSINKSVGVDYFDCLVCCASYMTVKKNIAVNFKHAASIKFTYVIV